MRRLIIFLVFPIILGGCVANFSDSSQKTSIREFYKGVVVKGFPSLPLYPKAQVVESFGYKNSYGASFISGDSLDKVIKFYRESFGKLGWESSLRKQSETNFVFDIKNKSYSGELIVNVAADGKRTAITAYLAPR